MSTLREQRRQRLAIFGRVQGVGFRPFVARLAKELGLGGFVGNDAQGVFVELQGSDATLQRFRERLHDELPPLARIQRCETTELALVEAEGPRASAFRIVKSAAGAEQQVAITPDSALCADCAAELRDPDDRRHRYPFINCTNCGPRYSIIRGIPYDRPLTTMAGFAMCPACQGEYDDPLDRRYHAQPNACPVCGPRCWLADSSGTELCGPSDDDPAAPLVEAARRLWAGEIVAIKGLGGVHLACRGDNDEVVRRLRERKGREAKPLALLVRDLEMAERLVTLDAGTRALLTSPEAPIALAPRRPGAPIAQAVAPGYAELGLMLPYTPLHALLMAPDLDPERKEDLPPLVLTSGNASGEPLSWRDDEAIERLGPLVDALLLHDRPIERPIDDSVVRAVASAADATAYQAAPTPLRRARGYVPDPLPLDIAAERPVLALGGDLKGALCLAWGQQAVLAEHLGDLENPAAFRNFIAAAERLEALLGQPPEVVVVDRHPAYHSARHGRQLAKDRGLELVEVQHHHGHAVACLVENSLPLDRPVVSLICDGTGYGDDGSIWGGEILVGDARGYRHAAGLWPLPLVGGDAAARQCWRPAAGLFVEHFADERDIQGALRELAEVSRSDVEPMALKLAGQRLAGARQGRSRAATPCSSLGRLFDAVASLLGLCPENRYEGEAATRLEAAAQRAGGARSTHGPKRLGIIAPLGGDALLAAHPLRDDTEGEGPGRLDSRLLVDDLCRRLRAGESSEELAWAFHEGIGRLLAWGTAAVAEAESLRDVVLSGGCFANRLLLHRVVTLLEAEDLRVHRHRLVPCGDGGLALGQAAIAIHTRAGGLVG